MTDATLLVGNCAAIAFIVMPFATASLSLRRSSRVHLVLGGCFPRPWPEVSRTATLIFRDESAGSAVSGDSKFGSGCELSSVLLHRNDDDEPVMITKDA